MGTFVTGYGGAADDHEGYAAQVLDDGSVTGTYSDQTTPRMIGQLVAACGCGWVGTTRYPTTELFDGAAQGFALAEWEHAHARPAQHRWQLDTCECLRGVLRGLAAGPAARLAPVPIVALSPAARLDVVDQVLAQLGRAVELARELRESLQGGG